VQPGAREARERLAEFPAVAVTAVTGVDRGPHGILSCYSLQRPSTASTVGW
jgi:hypothetical protein